MPIDPADPLVTQYRGTIGRLSSTPQKGNVAIPQTTTSAAQTALNSGNRSTSYTLGQSTAPAPAAPAPTGSSMDGEWTMPGITDPSWYAVSRGYQLQADTANQNANLQRANLEAQTGQTRGEIQYQGETNRRDIGYDAEGRGILRSGEYERNLAEQMRQEQMRLNQLDTTNSTGMSNIEQQLATTMAGLRSSFAEQAQTAAQQQYVREGVQAAQAAAAGGAQGTQAASSMAGKAINPQTGQPINGGIYLDDKGNYYTITNGTISNIGWDQIASLQNMGYGVQQLDPNNSKDFRTAAGVTW